MKIGMLVTSFPVAAQPFILNQIIGLRELGHEVHIYALCDTRHELSHPDVDAYDLQSLVTYLHIAASVFRRWVLLIQSLFSGKISLGPCRTIWSVRRLGLGAVTLRYFSFVQALHCDDYDVFYAHYLHNGGYAAAARLAKYARCCLVEGHGTVFTTEATDAVIRRLILGVDHIVAVSEDLASRLQKRGVPGKMVSVIHTGINLERFVFSPLPDGYGGGRCEMLCSGRLVPVKGHRFAIAALQILRERGVDAHLTLVGGGPTQDELVAYAVELEIRDFVRFVDLVSQDRLIDYYLNSHILLHPSITLPNGAAEGIPNSIKESMALGLAVVAFDSGGISELVIREKTGMLVPEEDVEMFADAIVRLLQDEELWQQVTTRAREEIEAHYSQEGVVKELESLLLGFGRFNHQGTKTQRLMGY